MTHGRRQLLAVAAVVALCGLAACSGRLPPSMPRSPAAPQVLVVLPPAPPSVWERYIIELAAEHRLYYYRAWKMESLGEVCIVYGLYPGEVVQRTVAQLAADPRVESAQVVQTFEVLGGAAEPRPAAAGSQPAALGGDPYAHLQQGAAAMRFDLAHRWATGRGVTVAVIDTGIDVGHPDLAGRVVRADNFVDRGTHSFTRDVHGTAVAGVVAAVAGNGIGIAGVAPDARIHALKACWPLPDRRPCRLRQLHPGAGGRPAVSAGARILNLSLSGPSDDLLARLLSHAIDSGVAVVAAVDETRADHGFPASLPGVIAVRAAPRSGEEAEPAGIATVSAMRPASDPQLAIEGPPVAAMPGDDGVLLAPGIDVLSTVPGGGYDFFSGASLAAAHVSGLAALLLERQPHLTPAELARRMRASEQGASAPGAVTAGVDACTAVADLVGLSGSCPTATDRLAR